MVARTAAAAALADSLNVELSVAGLRAASAVARAVPFMVASPIARQLGRLAGRRSKDQRMIVERNLRRAYGPALADADLPKLVRKVFENYAGYWLDSLRVGGLTAEQLDLSLSYEGIDNVLDPARSGKGVIAAIPHLGSWEAGARWLSEVQGVRVVAAVERLEPPELYDWFVEYRTKELGVEVVPVGPSAAAELTAALTSGALLTLLADRDLTGGGIEVEFFGERTKLPGGPALLALRTGRPLVPLAVFYEAGHHHAVILEALETDRRGRLRDDVARVTQDLARALERLIRIDPTQWHVLQPNWPSDYEALGIPDNDQSTGGEANTERAGEHG